MHLKFLDTHKRQTFNVNIFENDIFSLQDKYIKSNLFQPFSLITSFTSNIFIIHLKTH